VSGLFGTPELLRYPCECCAVVFVPPPARRQLGLGGRLVALGLALGQTLRWHTGLATAYRTIRPRRLALRNQAVFQEFALSFQFCPRCRGFVCRRCWHRRRKMCRACVDVERLRLVERSAGRLVEVVVRAAGGGPSYGLPGRLSLDWACEGAPAGDVGHDGRDVSGSSRPILPLPRFHPGPIRAVTSVAVMILSVLVWAAEVAYVAAAPMH
jgi:hypothetical protein